MLFFLCARRRVNQPPESRQPLPLKRLNNVKEDSSVWHWGCFRQVIKKGAPEFCQIIGKA
jgi:hypothetical protein